MYKTDRMISSLVPVSSVKLEKKQGYIHVLRHVNELDKSRKKWQIAREKRFFVVSSDPQ